jgi:purine-binding chemotaxis protein CheW
MADSAPVRLVVFRVGELVCAVPVAAVREIIPAQPATRIPGAPPAVDGLVNVRGTLLTVVNGRTVLDRPEPPGPDRSVLVLEVAGKWLGLEVDDVLDLLEVPGHSLAPKEALPGLDPRLVRAVGRRGDEVFVVLDTEALLAPLMTG